MRENCICNTALISVKIGVYLEYCYEYVSKPMASFWPDCPKTPKPPISITHIPCFWCLWKIGDKPSPCCQDLGIQEEASPGGDRIFKNVFFGVSNYRLTFWLLFANRTPASLFSQSG